LASAALRLDRSIAAGDDLLRSTNGGWLKRTEIPPDRSACGPAEELTELTAQRTADLIRTASACAAAGSEAHKVGDSYAAFYTWRPPTGQAAA